MGPSRVVVLGGFGWIGWFGPSAGAITPFTQEAVSRGINYSVRAAGGYPPHFGFGVAFVDFDRDGDPDVVVLGSNGGTIGLYENDGTGHFINRTTTSGLPAMASSGVAAADFDADGDLDLYFSGVFEPGVLARNDGGFTFTDVAASLGVVDWEFGTCVAWGDYDGDGWPDLYVSMYGPPNRLYRLLGPAIPLVDVAAALEVSGGSASSFQPVFFDYDLDGDADLYLSNDRNASICQHPNQLWKNLGTVYDNVTEISRTGACIDSMGVAVGDFDGNGFPDLYPTNTDNGWNNGNPLYLNQGNGTFEESAVAAGVTSNLTGWAAIFADFDNNAHLDLYVCNEGGANRLYMNSGTWPVTNVAAVAGVADASADTFGAAVGDVDGDGDLDLLVSSLDRQIRLFINHEGSLRRWLRLRIVGPYPNLDAIGAIAWVTADGVSQIREVLAGSNSYLSQNELVLHYGMNTRLIADSVLVQWPGGVTRQLTNLPTNRVWTVYPTSRLGDVDGDGQPHDAMDYVGLVGCVTGPVAVGWAPGCEMMDYDGDSDVDLRDYAAFQAASHLP